MKIAIDISPLSDKRKLGHAVRGVGFYLENLKRSLLEFYPNNEYVFFNNGDQIASDIDVVHYPYFEPFFLSLPFFAKHKTVVTVHDLTPLVFPKHFPPGIKGTIKWNIQKLALQKADAIITDSQCSKIDVEKYINIPQEKVSVAYLAAGQEFKRITDYDAKTIKEKYGLPDRFILYVGDVTWNKNIPRIIEAINKTNIPLVMIGKALREENIDRDNIWNKDLIISQNLITNSRNIKAIGFVSTDDLVLLYNAASALVMPSLYEGFGLPVLEAMNCGCPVITTNRGSLPEVAGTAAYYVDPENVEDMAQGIQKVFSNLDLQQDLREKGLQKMSIFSWQKTAEQTFAVYQKLIQINK